MCYLNNHKIDNIQGLSWCQCEEHIGHVQNLHYTCTLDRPIGASYKCNMPVQCINLYNAGQRAYVEHLNGATCHAFSQSNLKNSTLKSNSSGFTKFQHKPSQTKPQKHYKYFLRHHFNINQIIQPIQKACSISIQTKSEKPLQRVHHFNPNQIRQTLTKGVSFQLKSNQSNANPNQH